MTNYNSITREIMTIYNVLIFLFFILYTFRNKLRFKLSYVLTIASIYILISFILSRLFFELSSPYSSYLFVGLAIYIIISIILCRYLIDSHIMQVFFLIFVIFSTVFNETLFSVALIRTGIAPAFFEAEYLNIFYVTILLQTIAIPFLWYLFIGLFKRVIESDINYKYWKFIATLPMLYFALLIFGTFTEEAVLKVFTTKRLFELGLLNACIFLSYIIALRMLIQVHEGTKSKDELKIMERQLLMQKKQYDEISENIMSNRRAIHDWRQQLIFIKGFVDEGKLNDLSVYLNDYIAQTKPQDIAMLCTNRLVDSMLKYYYGIAKTLDINMTFSVDIPKNYPVSDSDLCIIFGNLIENAVDACRIQEQGRRYIQVKARIANNKMLVISISNSYDSEVTETKEGFLSSKHEGIGIGISSVDLVAKKNGGICKIEYDNHKFTASIILNIE